MFTFTTVLDFFSFLLQWTLFVIFKANSVLGHIKREYSHFLA